tara:strand:- start:5514 stop:5663 length:150 start_codon:yes stop_codon:yes gene_type:complete
MELTEKQNRKRKAVMKKQVSDMTAKQLRICTQLKIPPQDYVIVMNKIHI